MATFVNFVLQSTHVIFNLGPGGAVKVILCSIQRRILWGLNEGQEEIEKVLGGYLTVRPLVPEG